ncbi:MAG: GHMP kinase [Rhodothermales bacterium]|nr:GHMP kinase [Rhodothermales bacterium]
MEEIRQSAFARAGLAGNPSDGYHGKTLSVSVNNYCADVVLTEAPEVEIVPNPNDVHRFKSPRALAEYVSTHGYYGGVRLLKAAIKRFIQFCDQNGKSLDNRCFSVRYETKIPRQVGLAGSSAIVTAMLRALCQFYDVAIENEAMPSLVLSVEYELGLTAGLQDRVIQVYGGLVFMDFTIGAMHFNSGLACGRYEPMDPALLPPMYVAWSTTQSEPTEVFHASLRSRFDSGEPAVIAAMKGFANLADEARSALLDRDLERFNSVINRNYDLRKSITHISHGHERMIDTARETGVSAKFCGSGGAIVGTYRDEEQLRLLTASLAGIECEVVKLKTDS